MVDAAKLPQAPPDRKVQSIESVDAPSALPLRFALSEQDRIGDRIIAP